MASQARKVFGTFENWLNIVMCINLQIRTPFALCLAPGISCLFLCFVFFQSNNFWIRPGILWLGDLPTT